MINLSELLKDAPKDMKLYSPLFGEVKFKYITNSQFGIVVEDSAECSRSFDKYGRYFTIYDNAECLLFPAKGRSWEEWTVDTCRFKVLDWIVRNDGSSDVPVQIYGLKKDRYLVTNMLGSKGQLKISRQGEWRLWAITDAKDGDVLISKYGSMCIFKDNKSCYCYIDAEQENFYAKNNRWFSTDYTLKPANKEQRDTLMKAMADAGYTFDFERKELKKIEDEKYNGEDYGIDSLYHAQRILEKTLGKVDGYQSDDGILEHKCAITAVKKLYEHKPTNWSEEDERVYRGIHNLIYSTPHCNSRKEFSDWFKSIKDRVQSKQEWSEENKEIINRAASAIYSLSML